MKTENPLPLGGGFLVFSVWVGCGGLRGILVLGGDCLCVGGTGLGFGWKILA